MSGLYAALAMIEGRNDARIFWKYFKIVFNRLSAKQSALISIFVFKK